MVMTCRAICIITNTILKSARLTPYHSFTTTPGPEVAVFLGFYIKAIRAQKLTHLRGFHDDGRTRPKGWRLSTELINLSLGLRMCCKILLEAPLLRIQHAHGILL